MSKIGVDEKTYVLMYKRAFAECLARYRGDQVEARRLTQYYLRDWYVESDGADAREGRS